MKAAEYYLCLALGVVAVVLAVLVLITGRSAQGLQASLNAQQEEINKGALSQQIGTTLLRDCIQSALTNARMRELLQRNGITVNPAAAPAAPAAPSVPAKK
jgi:hypothetical protein